MKKLLLGLLVASAVAACSKKDDLKPAPPIQAREVAQPPQSPAGAPQLAQKVVRLELPKPGPNDVDVMSAITPVLKKQGFEVKSLLKGQYHIDKNSVQMFQFLPTGSSIAISAVMMTNQNVVKRAVMEGAGQKMSHGVYVYAPLCGKTFFWVEVGSPEEFTNLQARSLKGCQLVARDFNPQHQSAAPLQIKSLQELNAEKELAKEN